MHKILPMSAAIAAAVGLTGCETVQEQVAEALTDTYNAHLTGGQVVGAGDPDGMAHAEVSISDDFDQVCWDINDIAGIGTVTGAHIHMGAKGTNGPAVFTLTQDPETGDYTGCRNGAEWTENRIEGNPGMFYVQLHTAEYPNGAIRGQLGR